MKITYLLPVNAGAGQREANANSIIFAEEWAHITLHDNKELYIPIKGLISITTD